MFKYAHHSRSLSALSQLSSVELHVFTDALISAFASVVYVHFLPTPYSPTRLTFSTRKIPVGPVNPQNASRLELQTAALEHTHSKPSAVLSIHLWDK